MTTSSGYSAKTIWEAPNGRSMTRLYFDKSYVFPRSDYAGTTITLTRNSTDSGRFAIAFADDLSEEEVQ